MSLFGLFEGRSAPAQPPTTSLESPLTQLTGQNLAQLFGSTATDSGVNVTERNAATASTVYRAASLIASVSASLPFATYRNGTRDEVRSPLLEEPHPDLTRLDLDRVVGVQRCLWGNGYLQKRRNGGGQIVELWPITPDRVKPFWVRDERTKQPIRKAFEVENDWGVREIVLPHDLMQIPGLGYDGLRGWSPVRLGAQGIGLGLAAEKYGATLFGRGNLLSGYLTTDRDIEEDDAVRLQGRWRQKMAGLDRAHDVPVLDAGAKFVSMTMPNDEAQLLESRRFTVTDIARFFGVPPFLLGETEKSTSWGTGLEQQASGWVVFSLHPEWLAPYEKRATRELFRLDGRYAAYKLQGLLRGDSQARGELYRVLREMGAISANEIREREDMGRIADPAGDTYLQPTNLAPLGWTPAAGATGGQGTNSDGSGGTA